MTAIPDRRSESDADDIPVPWDQRPIVGERRGLPWWGAVLGAFGLAVIGAVIDMQTQDTLGWLFKGAYFIGSVGAVCAVQRRSLFGPMVQPPLILGITVPGVVLLVSGLPDDSDTLSKALAVGTPLINGFPTMAITTACTLVLGIVRIYRERDPDAKPTAADGKRPTDPKRPGSAARGGAGARGDAPRGRRPADRGEPVEGRGEGRPGAAAAGAVAGPAARRPARPPAEDDLRRRRDDVRRSGGRRGAEDDPRRASRRGVSDDLDDGRPGEAPRGGRRRGPEDERRAARRPVEDDPRREAGGRGGKVPPPGRRPRQRGGLPPEESRGGGPAAERPRRVPPPAGDPRRAPNGRRGTPPRRRPWDDGA
ncbi:hypothetical protein GCM10027445_14180 [Amycolatopsis endophytica]|uniref:DUF6542 domain-containing protein n=1 Tax=Amycolatopsis endophytica TaxID=860233 RepID=A0A853B426_9PSEU|nr:DUF6542 domain-containing protein [Amycolatopsis endophytica]NYI89554.1 hypothetical protein [Amycolatopsis endophytica]